MNTKLTHRLGKHARQKNLITQIVGEAGYLILAIIALLASAVTTQWTEQFITVAFLLGWKWICGRQTQVIQIYTTDPNEHNKV
jgi:hypothetical protein